MKTIPRLNLLLFVILAVGGCGLDLATKSWIFAKLGFPARESIVLAKNWFSLTTALNEGALFSMGQGFALVFAALSVGAALGIAYWLFVCGAIRDRWLAIALGCVMAGIGGNLYDRVGLPGLQWPFPPDRVGEPVYAVRDWLHFRIERETREFEPLLDREIAKQDIVFDWPVFNLADCFLVCGAALLFTHSLFPETKKSPEITSLTAAEGVVGR